jgi:hypothetical protein
MSADPSPISDELIRSAYDYWLRKRGARAMPSRTDIDPSEITKLLPHVMLVDVLGPSLYRYRLVGTKCAFGHGIDVTGRTLEEALKDAEYRTHVCGLYDECVNERRPVYSESLFFRERPCEVEHHVKVLFMPLSNDGAMVNMVFVAQVIDFKDHAVRDQHFVTI